MKSITSVVYGEKQLIELNGPSKKRWYDKLFSFVAEKKTVINKGSVSGRIIINGGGEHDNGPKSINVNIGPFQFELPEYISPKRYGFVETGKRKWKVGFVELRTLGKFKFMIRVDAFDKWHIGNIFDGNEDASIQYFIRMTNK